MTTNTNSQDPYKDIRPYNDDEVPAAIKRLLNDKDLINAIVNHRFGDKPNWYKKLLFPITRLYLNMRWSRIKTIEDMPNEVKKYMNASLKTSTDGVTYSGLEKLDTNEAYLFVSNHRDISMDPALVNWSLYHEGHNTVRIAIGDNLLSMPCATDLMKLNKSFIVKRSAKGPREMLAALSQLSAYIKHSLETKNSIWIAQREGRAKDGNDVTEPSILKMFHVEGRRQKIDFADYIKSLKIVPVAISYENDPLDLEKAKELYQLEKEGNYQKSEFEDIESIVKGITGYKGRVHVEFGNIIDGSFDTPEALAQEMDRQIYSMYKLYPVNYYAAGQEHKSVTDKTKEAFENKLAQLEAGAQQKLIAMYAKPFFNQQKIKQEKENQSKEVVSTAPGDQL